MIFRKQKIKGTYIIEPEPFSDKRGLLRRNFCQKEFKEAGLMTDIKQCNISENNLKYTLRGFHFQYPPNGEDKLISCIKGSLFNIVLDLRKESHTYLKWISFNLSEEDRLSLFIPKGCANAYLTLEDNTWIFYYHSAFYSPRYEGGIRYNDPFLNITWPAEPKVISNKDLNHPNIDPNKL